MKLLLFKTAPIDKTLQWEIRFWRQVCAYLPIDHTIIEELRLILRRTPR